MDNLQQLVLATQPHDDSRYENCQRAVTSIEQGKQCAWNRTPGEPRCPNPVVVDMPNPRSLSGSFGPDYWQGFCLHHFLDRVKRAFGALVGV